MVDDDPNELSVGIKSRLVAVDLELFSNLPGAQPVFAFLAAEHVGSCHLGSSTPMNLVYLKAPYTMYDKNKFQH
jgi:hypothetical protein